MLSMGEESRKSHWEKAYAEKGEAGVSWFEDRPAVSLDFIEQIGSTPATSLIDIGGGASRLVDALVASGWHSVTVLDISETALDAAKARLGSAAGEVQWIAADVTQWQPTGTYDIWHDRAAFHFLIDRLDREAYVERLGAAVKPGGHAIIATFAPDGPERCSGLPVVRYDAAALAHVVGPAFELEASRNYLHQTPWGSTQSFQFSLFRRIG
jgi:2-polyprenyl-3-methyl-5-hydroxy-6-metoxy-1,4-benzoquinol methylase